MTKFNPYEVLGVSGKAGGATIRAAYRKLVQTHHPDKGGERDTFERIQRAYDLLMDEGRRERYDRTGDADDVKPDQTIAAAMQIITSYLSDVVQQAVSANQHVTTLNVLESGRQQISARLQSVRAAKEKALRHIAQIERLGKRLKRKASAKPGDDLIVGSLKWQIEQVRLQLVPLEANIAAMEMALDILADYDFEIEAQIMSVADVVAYARANGLSDILR